MIPDSVDTRALNLEHYEGNVLTIEEMKQNHILCINSLLSHSTHHHEIMQFHPEILCNMSNVLQLNYLYKVKFN